MTSEPQRRTEALDSSRRANAAAETEGVQPSAPARGTEPTAPGLRGLRPGDRLGEYRIEEPLGKGGMGTVYAARHLQLGVRRALKLQLVGSDKLRARFEREALALARVDRHPGVVRLHEHGHGGPDGRTAYVVMDLVEGGTLADALRAGGRLPLERALPLGAALAEALDHVHRAGIVHRDLKPANVLLRAGDDQPLLADFGLAWDDAQERLTATGHLVGTIQYMSPEQVAGARTYTPASDVFSLGVVLYEALAGEPPFQGETLVELMSRIASAEAAPLTGLRPEVPRGVSDLLAAMMRADPADRPSAAEVAAALRRAADGEPLEVTGAASRRPWLLGAGALLLALLVAALAASTRSPAPPAPATPTSSPSPLASRPAEPPPPSEQQVARQRAMTGAMRLLERRAQADRVLAALQLCARRPGEPRPPRALTELGRRLVRTVLEYVLATHPAPDDLVSLMARAADVGAPIGRDPIVRELEAYFLDQFISLRPNAHASLFVDYVRLDLPLEVIGTMSRVLRPGRDRSPAAHLLRLHNATYPPILARSSERRDLLRFLNSDPGQALGPVARAHGLILAAGVSDHSPAEQQALIAEARRLDPQHPALQAAEALALAREGRRAEARAALAQVPRSKYYLIGALRAWTLAFCGDRKAVSRELTFLAHLGMEARSVRHLSRAAGRVLADAERQGRPRGH